MSKSKVGVIIGRFQVPELHAGHRRLIEEVAAQSDRVVVLLGVSPVDGYTAENPLTFLQRQAIVRASVRDIPVTGDNTLASLDDLTIMPLPDQRTNGLWSAQLDSLLWSTFPQPNYQITLYGGRNSFKDSYQGSIEVRDSTFYPPIPATGTQRRADIKEKNSADFYAGQIYALQRQFPHCYPTVDVALMKDTWNTGKSVSQIIKAETLLIQRADSGNWCFPGGFADPGESFVKSAQRELHEEVGLILDLPTFTFIDSFPINDFRYRGSRDKITTSFFTVPYTWGVVTCNPDEVQDYKWVDIFDVLSKDVISEVHQPLLGALQMYYHRRNDRLYREALDAAHAGN